MQKKGTIIKCNNIVSSSSIYRKSVRTLAAAVFFSYNNKYTRRYRPYQMFPLCTRSCKLFSFQQRYVYWLHYQRLLSQESLLTKQPWRGVIINADRGMGKTAITLTDIKHHGLNALFICPPNVVTHIIKESEKHLGSSVSTSVITAWPTFESDFADITIVSYHTLTRLNKLDVKKYNRRFTTCVVDEVHDAFQKEGVREMILGLICADFYIGLTAEIRSSLLPMLSMLDSQPINHRCFTFRQPPIFNYHKITVEMSASVRPEYEILKDEVKNSKKNALLKHKLLKKSWALLSLDKVPRIVQELKTKESHFKVVVTSQFSATLHAIAKHLSTTQFSILDTKIRTQAKRRFVLDYFEHSTTCTFLLASFDIIYIGLNLGFVDYLILADFPYDASDKFQMFGRLRRLGQRPRNLAVQEIVEIVVEKSSDSVLYDCEISCKP